MKYYEIFFKTPFPFEKYDHIFCPEYNVGAMEENSRAITVIISNFLKVKIFLYIFIAE